MKVCPDCYELINDCTCMTCDGCGHEQDNCVCEWETEEALQDE